MYVYVCVYVFGCVCVCVRVCERERVTRFKKSPRSLAQYAGTAQKKNFREKKCSELQCVASLCRVLQCVLQSVLQCVAVCYK